MDLKHASYLSGLFLRKDLSRVTLTPVTPPGGDERKVLSLQMDSSMGFLNGKSFCSSFLVGQR